MLTDQVVVSILCVFSICAGHFRLSYITVHIRRQWVMSLMQEPAHAGVAMQGARHRGNAHVKKALAETRRPCATLRSSHRLADRTRCASH